MIEITEINDFDEMLALENDWDRLLDTSPSKTIFMTFEWITNWWKYHGEGKDLMVLLAKSKENLIGMAPLMKVKKSGIVQFIGTGLSDYCDFIIQKRQGEVLKAMLQHLRNRKSSSLELREIPETSSTLPILRKVLSKSQLHHVESITATCPSLVLSQFTETDLKKMLNKKNLKWQYNRLKREGDISFDYLENIGEINDGLNVFFRFHISRWKDTKKPSIFEKQKNQEFCRKIVESFHKQNAIRFMVMKLVDNPIAILINFVYDNKVIGYAQAFDLNYSKFSPTILAIRQDISTAFSNQIGEYDMSRGNESYKFRFSNTIRNNYSLTITDSHIHHIINLCNKKGRHWVRNKILKRGNP